MGHLSPKDIVIYQKGSYPPIFATPEERTKEDPWGDTQESRILVQDKRLEEVEDLLTPTKSPSQIPTNLEEVGKYAVGADLTRDDMAKLCSTEYLLVQDEREILVWHHRLNHCYFKYPLRLSKKRIIPRNLSNIRPSSFTPPDCGRKQ